LHLGGDAIVLPWREVAAVIAWPVLQAPAYAILGVAVGLIVRNQVGALVAAFAWALLVETIVAGLAPGAGDYLPVAAIDALGAEGGISTSVAALAAAAWIAALTGAGAVLVRARDLA
jgi:ABC-2 type transport system permease protein